MIARTSLDGCLRAQHDGEGEAIGLTGTYFDERGRPTLGSAELTPPVPQQ